MVPSLLAALAVIAATVSLLAGVAKTPDAAEAVLTLRLRMHARVTRRDAVAAAGLLAVTAVGYTLTGAIWLVAFIYGLVSLELLTGARWLGARCTAAARPDFDVADIRFTRSTSTALEVL